MISPIALTPCTVHIKDILDIYSLLHDVILILLHNRGFSSNYLTSSWEYAIIKWLLK